MTDRLAGRREGSDGTEDTAPSTPASEGIPAGGATPPGDGGGRGDRLGGWRRRTPRVSRWDRPAPVKDWRYVVGIVGRVLIVTGLLMFGFVAYQLWGTGIETARAQNQLADRFEQAVPISEPTDLLTTVPPDPASPEPASPDPTSDDPASDDPASPDPASDDPASPVAEPVASDIIPGGIDLSDGAVDQAVPPIEIGDPVARLEIPAIGKDLYVVAGVALDQLKDGPGHYPETPLPGQLGNASIAGHRTTYGAPFFDVDQLVAGDRLIVTTVTGGRFVYEVTGSEVVEASDYWVITTRDPNVAELTLTSCHPKYSARQRIIVHSVLVPELSDEVGLPEFYESESEQSGPSSDDPADADPALVPPSTVASPTPTPPGSTAETAAETTEETTAENTATSVATPDTTPAAGGDGTDPTTTTVPASDTGTTEIDGFGQGWFEDSDAWPQIALWGAALALISAVAFRISRLTRHDSIGIAAGIAPFLVSLYFFYQNINRLLPPGL